LNLQRAEEGLDSESQKVTSSDALALIAPWPSPPPTKKSLQFSRWNDFPILLAQVKVRVCAWIFS